ncbi:NAD-dependent succinate-semialdehyde dehydrogenase [Paenibacillus radicis (ex Xue et al. 2023)]|uniref:NAD-dependent succinate-semialdehyde dehydrogenase n=1 Tax=Paenibacillus radicis (ex Xue et al. 2023) TaxID=2972489 RepID=A0ABT1YP91_9BACL|nr:NAD-dependent succinate-semialdehyde dehydrogenase [Paenibacillus radicis (ex Xue et al. 2023)]MCR8634199.1 NAD-dependent succinate-semialdehyde dehydrogenase [Paenibacillus radicis (ex Xue et al. 2023)]
MRGLLYINGKWEEPSRGAYFPSYNPATGEQVGEAADGSREDVQRAVEAASKAFPAWSQMTALERADLMMDCYHRINAEFEELAEILTVEQGKPLQEARNELVYANSFFRWFAEEARRIYGDTVPANSKDKRLLVIRQPVGVVAAISTWNFPQAMVTRKIAPALAAGCTIVVKPAKHTPLNAVALFKIFEKVGFPPGVLNLITTSTSSEVGDEFLTNPAIRKITFTGSTEVGKYLIKRSADQVKKVSMELGGHAPFIVFADADLEDAVNGVIGSKFRNAGQTCICANRVYVERSVKEPFEALLVEKVNQLKLGDGLDPGTTIGPLIDEGAVEKSKEHVDDAVSQGAKVLTGGKRAERQGQFFEPTILSDVNENMLICKEETFGPVAPLMVFDSEEEVIARANNVPYGLASYFYTKDLSRAFRVAEKLQYGIVGLNDPFPSVAQAPFGGVKESGIGREGGKEGIDDFLETKYISMKIYSE